MSTPNANEDGTALTHSLLLKPQTTKVATHTLSSSEGSVEEHKATPVVVPVWPQRRKSARGGR